VASRNGPHVTRRPPCEIVPDTPAFRAAQPAGRSSTTEYPSTAAPGVAVTVTAKASPVWNVPGIERVTVPVASGSRARLPPPPVVAVRPSNVATPPNVAVPVAPEGAVAVYPSVPAAPSTNSGHVTLPPENVPPSLTAEAVQPVGNVSSTPYAAVPFEGVTITPTVTPTPGRYVVAPPPNERVAVPGARRGNVAAPPTVTTAPSNAAVPENTHVASPDPGAWTPYENVLANPPVASQRSRRVPASHAPPPSDTSDHPAGTVSSSVLNASSASGANCTVTVTVSDNP